MAQPQEVTLYAVQYRSHIFPPRFNTREEAELDIVRRNEVRAQNGVGPLAYVVIELTPSKLRERVVGFLRDADEL